jgi:xylobiose transport system substrate-binding protein
MDYQAVTRRRFLAQTAAGAALLGGLAACGSSGPGGSGGDAQIWVDTDAAENPIQQAAVDAFNKSASTKMTLVKVPSTQSMNDKVRTAMGSPNRPNIFFNWGGGSIRDYAESNRLVDFTPKFNADPKWRDSFLPSVLKAGQIDNKYYGIPMKGIQPVVLFYNKTMFAQYKLSPPKTWDDLLSLIRTIKSKDITPIVLGGSDSWTELMYLEYLVDRLGAPSVFANLQTGKPDAWTDPVILKSLKMIRSLVDMGTFGSNYQSIGFGNGSASALFAKGKAAMHLMGTWEFTGQVKSAPTFAHNDLGFSTFPTVPDGKGDPSDVVGNPTNYFSVTKSGKSDACVSFLKKEMTSEAYVTALIKAGDIPAVTGLDAQLKQNAPNPDFAATIYSMVQKAPNFTLSWDQALSPSVGDAVVTNLQKVFNKQIQPEAFVTAMQKAK